MASGRGSGGAAAAAAAAAAPTLGSVLHRLWEHLRCPICLGVLESPQTTPCNHQFCSDCIQQHLTSQKVCPQCRQDITKRSLSENAALGHLIGDVKEVVRCIVLDSNNSVPSPLLEIVSPLRRSSQQPLLRRASSATAAKPTVPVRAALSFPDEDEEDADGDDQDQDQAEQAKPANKKAAQRSSRRGAASRGAAAAAAATAASTASSSSATRAGKGRSKTSKAAASAAAPRAAASAAAAARTSPSAAARSSSRASRSSRTASARTTTRKRSASPAAAADNSRTGRSLRRRRNAEDNEGFDESELEAALRKSLLETGPPREVLKQRAASVSPRKARASTPKKRASPAAAEAPARRTRVRRAGPAAASSKNEPPQHNQQSSDDSDSDNEEDRGKEHNKHEKKPGDGEQQAAEDEEDTMIVAAEESDDGSDKASQERRTRTRESTRTTSSTRRLTALRSKSSKGSSTSRSHSRMQPPPLTSSLSLASTNGEALGGGGGGGGGGDSISLLASSPRRSPRRTAQRLSEGGEAVEQATTPHATDTPADSALLEDETPGRATFERLKFMVQDLEAGVSDTQREVCRKRAEVLAKKQTVQSRPADTLGDETMADDDAAEAVDAVEAPTQASVQLLGSAADVEAEAAVAAAAEAAAASAAAAPATTATTTTHTSPSKTGHVDVAALCEAETVDGVGSGSLLDNTLPSGSPRRSGRSAGAAAATELSQNLFDAADDHVPPSLPAYQPVTPKGHGSSTRKLSPRPGASDGSHSDAEPAAAERRAPQPAGKNGKGSSCSASPRPTPVKAKSQDRAKNAGKDKENKRGPSQASQTTASPARTPKGSRRPTQPACSPAAVLLLTHLDTPQVKNTRKLALLLGLEIVKEYSDRVTHIVTKTDKGGNAESRTLKFMQALCGGKWLVRYDWIESCLQARRLVAEEPFEVNGEDTYQDGAPRKARLDKTSGKPGLLSGFRICYKIDDRNFGVNKRDLNELITMAGGVVLDEAEFQQARLQADGAHTVLLYDPSLEVDRIEVLNSMGTMPHDIYWLFDSISSHSICSLDEYPIDDGEDDDEGDDDDEAEIGSQKSLF